MVLVAWVLIMVQMVATVHLARLQRLVAVVAAAAAAATRGMTEAPEEEARHGPAGRPVAVAALRGRGMMAETACIPVARMGLVVVVAILRWVKTATRMGLATVAMEETVGTTAPYSASLRG